MRKLLNILYITQPKAYLYKDGQNVVVSVDQKELFRIPVVNIEGIVSFSYIGCSPGLIKLCADSNVSIAFLSPTGRFISRFNGPLSGNVVLRKMQYQFVSNEDKSLHLSRIIVASKIHNYRSILQRYIRDYGASEDISYGVKRLNDLKFKVLNARDKGELRGFEGVAAHNYFANLPSLIISQKDGFPFTGRNRRPPRDAVNAMLSFMYTILTNEIVSALESVGLDPQMGVFHSMRPGRYSLALDIVEEFRAYLCDRLVLTLINRGQITPSDFRMQGSESVIMTEKGRNTILSAWQNRKREEIMHPYLQEKVSIGLLPYLQAMLMARYIRGEMDDYPPYLIK